MAIKKYTFETIEDVTKIHITNRKGMEFELLIDTEDFNKIINTSYCWFPAKNHSGYYIATTIYLGIIDKKPQYKTLLLHRFLTEAKENDYVDHINHNTLDNRKSNLRVIENALNVRHRKGVNVNNKSGYRNVAWCKNSNKWMVQLQVDGKNKQLGYFEDVHEAGEFAKEMRQKYYGEFAGEG